MTVYKYKIKSGHTKWRVDFVLKVFAPSKKALLLVVRLRTSKQKKGLE